MVITDIVMNTLLGRVTRHPAGMHCPSWDDAFVSSYYCYLQKLTNFCIQRSLYIYIYHTVLYIFRRCSQYLAFFVNETLVFTLFSILFAFRRNLTEIRKKLYHVNTA